MNKTNRKGKPELALPPITVIEDEARRLNALASSSAGNVSVSTGSNVQLAVVAKEQAGAASATRSGQPSASAMATACPAGWPARSSSRR